MKHIQYIFKMLSYFILACLGVIIVSIFQSDPYASTEAYEKAYLEKHNLLDKELNAFFKAFGDPAKMLGTFYYANNTGECIGLPPGNNLSCQKIRATLTKLECGRVEISEREIKLHLSFGYLWSKKAVLVVPIADGDYVQEKYYFIYPNKFK